MTENNYALIGTAQDNRKCSEALDRCIEKLFLDIEKIKKRYPDCGIGDTDTDEAIAEAVYYALHSFI